jgi:hypothetical protein
MFLAVQRRVSAAIHQEPYLGLNALGDAYLAGKRSPHRAVIFQVHRQAQQVDAEDRSAPAIDGGNREAKASAAQ